MPLLRLGTTDVVNPKLGTTDIEKIFYGTNLAYQRTSLWTPLSEGAGLRAWYSAMNPASLGSPANNAAATKVDDISGNGLHLAQATAANRAIYQSTGINTSFPTLSFDGTNDYFSRSGVVLWNAGGPFLIFALYNIATPAAARTAFADGHSAANNQSSFTPLFAGAGDPANVRSKMNNTAASQVYSSIMATGDGWGGVARSYTFLADGTTMSPYLDGVVKSTRPDEVRSQCVPNQFSLGCRLGSAVNELVLGKISEVCVFWGASATATVARKAEGYFHDKYGLLARLAAGHPWKSTPPTV